MLNAASGQRMVAPTTYVTPCGWVEVRPSASTAIARRPGRPRESRRRRASWPAPRRACGPGSLYREEAVAQSRLPPRRSPGRRVAVELSILSRSVRVGRDRAQGCTGLKIEMKRAKLHRHNRSATSVPAQTGNPACSANFADAVGRIFELFLVERADVLAQCASSEACAGGRDSSASEVISSGPWAASSSTSVASSAERA